MFVLDLFFSCVVCFHFRHLICIMLCLCCLVFLLKTGLSGFVVGILWSSILLLFCFEFCLCLFFIPLKKRPSKNRTQQKPQKTKKKQKKNRQKTSVSAIVFTNSVPNFLGVGLKMQASLKTL